jgi:hypothetical protein
VCTAYWPVDCWCTFKLLLQDWYNQLEGVTTGLHMAARAHAAGTAHRGEVLLQARWALLPLTCSRCRLLYGMVVRLWLSTSCWPSYTHSCARWDRACVLFGGAAEEATVGFATESAVQLYRVGRALCQPQPLHLRLAAAARDKRRTKQTSHVGQECICPVVPAQQQCWVAGA